VAAVVEVRGCLEEDWVVEVVVVVHCDPAAVLVVVVAFHQIQAQEVALQYNTTILTHSHM